MPREEPSESEHISSWRGDLLVGFLFFLLRVSCLGCFKYSVASSVTVQRREELLESTSSLERDRGEAEGCLDLTAPGCAQKSPAHPCRSLYALSRALGVGHFRLTSFSSCLLVGAPHRRENLAMWTSRCSVKKQLTQAQVPQYAPQRRALSTAVSRPGSIVAPSSLSLN